MKLRDLKIATQMRIGLGLILACVVFLGILTWKQTNVLWQQGTTMYRHPLQVRRAVGTLETDVQSMSIHVRDLFLVQTDQERMTTLQNLEICIANTERQLAILDERYLGSPDDIAAVRGGILKWHVLRSETVRLLRAGETEAAKARIRPGGSQDVQAQMVRGHLRTIDDFAQAKSDELLKTSDAQVDTVKRQLATTVCIILLLSVVVAWWLLRGIKQPLAALTAAAEQFRTGKMDVRVGSVSANEFGTLSAAFNTMADTIQTEMEVARDAAQLADVMLREDELQAFCRELLKALLAHTGSQVGAVYLPNETGTVFEHYESIGLGAGGRAAFSATDLEGELGVALATRRIQHITDIPADTRFTFPAASGDFTPREILTIPVLSDHSVAAVVSLASVHAYTKPARRLVDDIWSVLTARVNGVLAFREARRLAERLEGQNQELEAQGRELSTQAAEVAEQNTELETQKRELAEANRLKSAFLSNMSHELRTPLNSVIALSGVLSRRLADAIPAEEYGYLEVIERNGKSLLTLINDILDLSRVEAGREEISVSRFSVRDVAGDVVAMLEPQAQEKGIALLNQAPADLPPITSDPDKILHILQNLVSNAVKFTEQGQVTIAAESVPPSIRNPQSAIRNPHFRH